MIRFPLTTNPGLRTSTLLPRRTPRSHSQKPPRRRWTRRDPPRIPFWKGLDLRRRCHRTSPRPLLWLEPKWTLLPVQVGFSRVTPLLPRPIPSPSQRPILLPLPSLVHPTKQRRKRRAP